MSIELVSFSLQNLSFSEFLQPAAKTSVMWFGQLMNSFENLNCTTRVLTDTESNRNNTQRLASITFRNTDWT